MLWTYRKEVIGDYLCMSKGKNATTPRRNTKAPTTEQRVRDVLGGQMGLQTMCEHVDDVVVVQSCRSSCDFPTRKPCEQLHSSQSVSVSSSPTPLTTAHRLLANDVALSPERRMARRSRLSWVIAVHCLFSCLSQSHAQSISTSTPVPPLQWLNITGLLQGSPAPPLKYASIGYDDTTRNLIIFGGQASSGIPTAQTFLYDIVLSPSPPLTLHPTVSISVPINGQLQPVNQIYPKHHPPQGTWPSAAMTSRPASAFFSIDHYVFHLILVAAVMPILSSVEKMAWVKPCQTPG